MSIVNLISDWFSGIGIHSGRPGRVRFQQKPGKKVCFLKNGIEIPIDVSSVCDTKLSTVLSFDGESISTVEHLLATLHIFGIWRGLLIEVEGPEIPIFDGSALIWAQVLKDFPKEEVQSIKPTSISLELNGSLLQLEPGETWFDVSVDFPPPIGYQTWQGGKDRLMELLDARTFGFASDVAPAQAAGKALGLRPDNAVLYTDSGPRMPTRGHDEPVRHKALDLLGDLYLVGAPIKGKISVHKGSHQSHIALAKAISQAVTS